MVDRGPGEQLLVSALLRHPAILEDDDVVEADDGGDPVGHQPEGAIPR